MIALWVIAELLEVICDERREIDLSSNVGESDDTLVFVIRGDVGG